MGAPWWWSDIAVGVVELACAPVSLHQLVGEADDAAGPPHSPCVLHPDLFPEGLVPPSYADIHCAFSRSALGLLQRGPVDDGAVALELARCATELEPNPDLRRAALTEYAAWLERRANGGGLDRQSTTLSHETIQTRLIARLLHTQAVRLRGPGADLATEAAIVTALASATSST